MPSDDPKQPDAAVAAPQPPEDVNEPAESTQSDPVELLAMKLGWNPDHPGPDALDAETYILRSREITDNLSKQVRNQRKELSALREGIDAIRWNAEQTRKQEVGQLKTQIQELKKHRAQAIKDGDVDGVEGFDDQIQTLQESIKEPPKPAAANQPPPEYFDFIEVNPWYLTDMEMRQYADALSKLPEVSALPYPRLLKRVAEATVKEFADKMPTPGKAAAPAPPAHPTQPAAVAAQSPQVTSSRLKATKPAKSKATAADLSYDQRRVGQDFVSHGVYKSLDDYAHALQAMLESETPRAAR